MDPTEDWSGNCQIKNETQKNENKEINQVIPGYASFHDYVQV